MEPSDALRRGPRVVVDRPPDVLSFYLFAASAAVVARVPLVAAGAVAVASLAADGRIGPAVRALRSFDPADPASAPSGLEPAVARLVTPTVVAALAVGLFASLVLLLLMRAATTAATLAAVYAALRGESIPAAGAAGVGRHWRALLGVALLRAAVLAAAGASVAAAAAFAAADPSPGRIAAAGVVGTGALGVVLAAHLALAFAGQAVVVDGAGTRAAVRRSAGIPVRRPWAFVVYVLIALAAVGGFGGAALALSGVGAPQVAGLLSTLVVVPAFDGFKTALYADVPSHAAEGARPGRHRAGGIVRTGLRRLASFVRDRPSANAASAACLLAGGVGGWLLTEPYGTLLDPAGGQVTSFGAPAPMVFLNIAANNWLVAAATGYGGSVLGVPAAANLFLNGAFIGALAGVTAPTGFLALVAPHGVLELPAIVVAGGLGFHLAGVTWRGYRGRLSAAAVGDAFVEAFEVLVGLGVVFVVAAFVETFVTPLVAAAALP